jgi:hypothetical protein
MIAPLDVGGRPAAAGLRHVDHVVVNQRGGVDHFDHGAELDGRLAAGLAARRRSARRAAEARAQTLAAALLQITADGGDGLDRRQRFDVDRLLDLFQIFAHEIEDLARGQDLPCPFSFHRKPQCNGSHFAGATQPLEVGRGQSGDASGVVPRTSASFSRSRTIMDGSLRFPR